MDQAQVKAVKPVVQFIERLQQTGGLKGTDIANFTGVSKATVSRWTTGQKSPSRIRIARRSPHGVADVDTTRRAAIVCFIRPLVMTFTA